MPDWGIIITHKTTRFGFKIQIGASTAAISAGLKSFNHRGHEESRKLDSEAFLREPSCSWWFMFSRLTLAWKMLPAILLKQSDSLYGKSFRANSTNRRDRGHCRQSGLGRAELSSCAVLFHFRTQVKSLPASADNRAGIDLSRQSNQSARLRWRVFDLHREHWRRRDQAAKRCARNARRADLDLTRTGGRAHYAWSGKTKAGKQH